MMGNERRLWGRSPQNPHSAENAETWLCPSTAKMHTFELRPFENGFELRGGHLPEPMIFRDVEPRPAVHLVGFLSQKFGSELLIFNAAGEVIQTRRFEPVLPIPGAVGGLHGPYWEKSVSTCFEVGL
jgi:hypothetical protein